MRRALGKVEELLLNPCWLPTTDFCHHTIDTGIDLCHILLPIKAYKRFDIICLKTAPSRYMNAPEILRLIANASSAHLHRYASYLFRDITHNALMFHDVDVIQ